MRFHLFTLISLFFLACQQKRAPYKVEKGTITESVYASVIIQPDSLYYAHSVVSGILDRILVEEGTEVEIDEGIIEIINNTPKLNSENSKLSYELAMQNYKGSATILKSIKDEIEAARLQFQNDSINFLRRANLWEQNIGSKAQFDAAKLSYQLSKNKLYLLEDKLSRTESELKIAVEQSRNNYQASLINTTDFTIKSKINGKVYALYKEPGEIVTVAEPVAAIGSASNFIIEMLVDEVDIVRIAENQKVLITLDSYRSEVFEAIVFKIYPKKDERNQTFLVEARFKTKPPKLYPGLSGEANIIIAYKEDVLTIPKSYLISGNQVLTDDGLKSIKTGLENLEYIEITTGLSESTLIYLDK